VSFAQAAEPTVGGRHLDKQVADAFRGLLNDGLNGDVLVFLPGMAEMRRAQEACAGLCARNDIMSVLLHAELPPDEQNRAVRPQQKRKLILSTNVAESSVTIDGVVAVVDSGLARIPSHAAWSGLTVLKVAKVSRASATQRAGRAGRTQAGRCVRLYTRHDHDSRPEHTPPEIRRLDLAETALMLHGVDVTNLAAFPFYEAPESSSLKAAEELLLMLQAVDGDGKMTPMGRQMLRLPLHPRQARVLLEAAQRGLPREGALVAAILGEGDMVSSSDGGRGAQKRAHHGCDVMAALDAVETAQAGGSLARQAGALGLDVGALSRVDRTQKQLSSIVRSLGIPPTATPKDEHTVLQQALLTGYADRVAARRQGQHGDNAEYLLAMGGTARVLPSSAASGSPLLVALDVEERVGGRNDGVKIRQASAVELDWLLDVVPHLLTDSVDVEWNAQAERVEAWSRLKLLQLSLEEKRLDKPDHPRVGELLAQQALKAGVGIFAEVEALQKFRARVQLMRQHVPEAEFPDVTEESFKDALRAVCEGRRSFKELKDADVLEQLHALLTYEQRQQLGNEVPGEVRLPGGRRTQVHYVMGQPPWVESRLQDFFGQLQTPRILRGRVPLNVHLLAPNHRAVQITNDLSGFWERHYQGIRRELMRKYPRHSWPEDPTTAEPPQPKPRPH
jgi:ATP-dependent helicase HrpB